MLATPEQISGTAPHKSLPILVKPVVTENKVSAEPSRASQRLLSPDWWRCRESFMLALYRSVLCLHAMTTERGKRKSPMRGEGQSFEHARYLHKGQLAARLVMRLVRHLHLRLALHSCQASLCAIWDRSGNARRPLTSMQEGWLRHVARMDESESIRRRACLF